MGDYYGIQISSRKFGAKVCPPTELLVFFAREKSDVMFVVKRNGLEEEVKFDKITARITKLCYGLNPKYVDPVCIYYKLPELNSLFNS